MRRIIHPSFIHALSLTHTPASASTSPAWAWATWARHFFLGQIWSTSVEKSVEDVHMYIPLLKVSPMECG